MANLKLKLKLNGLEFEIEGEEATVKEEFDNFKAFFNNDILPKTNVASPQIVSTHIIPAAISGDVSEQPLPSSDNFPVLKEVIKKDLLKTESDWILVYAFYYSNFGESSITEKNIRAQYEQTNRKTLTRSKNITNNIKSLLKKGYIKMQNDKEFIILPAGINYAKEVLEGRSTPLSLSRKIKKTEGKTQNKSSKPAFVDLGLSKEEITSLSTFYKTKKPRGQNEEVIVVMKWFKDNTSNQDISIEEISYLLSVCSKVPTALSQVLVNIKGNGLRWATNASQGKVKLTSIGESYLDNSLPKTA